MPSPVAHSLIGLAMGFAWFLPGGQDWRSLARRAWAQRGWILLCIVLATAPDIDFLFGISRGNLNFYHQTGTHTLGWIGLVSFCVWVLAWSRHHDRSAGWFFFILALTGSHLIADISGIDTSPPYGIMIAWPFSEHYWHSPVALFPAVAKTTWADLWSLHNVGVIAVEIMIILPIVAIVLLWKQMTAPATNQITDRMEDGLPIYVENQSANELKADSRTL